MRNVSLRSLSRCVVARVTCDQRDLGRSTMFVMIILLFDAVPIIDFCFRYARVAVLLDATARKSVCARFLDNVYCVDLLLCFRRT
jgi:hypothetical protein